MGVGRYAVLSAVLFSTAANAGGWVSVLDGLIKVRPGQVLPASADRVRVSLARNECEGAQLRIAPGARGVKVSVSSPLPGLQITSFREEYLPVLIPSSVDTSAGLWPDALVPGPAAFPADSTAARPLVVYLEICADDQLAAGTYRSTVTVTAENRKPRKIPLQVQVHRFGLPATSSLPNTFGISLYSIAHAHGLDPESAQAQDLLQGYGRSLLEHRLSPFGMSQQPPKAKVVGDQVVVDFTRYDRDMAHFFEGRDTPRGARFTTAQLFEAPKTFTDPQRVQYYAQVREHFREKNWNARLFFYAKDEPKPADFPLVLAQSRRVRAAGKIPVLVTSWLDPTLTPAADIACPVINCFFQRDGVQTCKRVATVSELRKQLPADGQVWWYQSCMSHGCDGGPAPTAEQERAYTGWASYMVDHSGPRNRAMGALGYLVGIEGELYWDTVFAYQEKDAWRDQFAFGGNGDGTLFYPGTPARLGTSGHAPVASLRLKHIRDGLEDYEYLKLLESLGERELAQRLVKQLVKSGYQITEDPTLWQAVRSQVAAAIHRRLEFAERPSVGKTP
ncbi:MAG: DUF4091 domain-containing protein [Myxococcota bacterium]|nr:DUF4091 domain-containing protein [Myxococcota bacterium]